MLAGRAAPQHPRVAGRGQAGVFFRPGGVTIIYSNALRHPARFASSNAPFLKHPPVVGRGQAGAGFLNDRQRRAGASPVDAAAFRVCKQVRSEVPAPRRGLALLLWTRLYARRLWKGRSMSSRATGNGPAICAILQTSTRRSVPALEVHSEVPAPCYSVPAVTCAPHGSKTGSRQHKPCGFDPPRAHDTCPLRPPANTCQLTAAVGILHRDRSCKPCASANTCQPTAAIGIIHRD